uniref:BTB domain-containing protein n=1 Tax=Rhizophagus irregularis (strain DAOM 181602 / DAOM 197198 / MUCL 43194) TaxID=747089 RepID=U9U2P1_RHIID
MSSQNKDERIVLNIGGIKYETYRSTLTAYPDTLLGTMFQERNEELLKPNKNEYFFDRNGKAFHYIMEYYRTEIEDELKNSIKELIKLEITHNPELISVIRRPPHYNLNFRIQNIL